MKEDTALLSTGKMDLQQRRNKTPARVYYVLLTIVFMILFLDSVVSLGCFGVVQRELHNFKSKHTQCILFGSLGKKLDGSSGVDLPRIGTCAYVLWGQVSILILSVVWIVYCVAQAVIAPRVISALRILDFLVLGLSFLFSFALSITVTAGLNKTCEIYQQVYRDQYKVCTQAALSYPNGEQKLFFYNRVHAAQSSLWVACMMFLFLTIWNVILVIVYFAKVKNRRRQAFMARRLQDEDGSQASDTSSEPEELGNVAEDRKPDSPFAHT